MVRATQESGETRGGSSRGLMGHRGTAGKASPKQLAAGLRTSWSWTGATWGSLGLQEQGDQLTPIRQGLACFSNFKSVSQQTPQSIRMVWPPEREGRVDQACRSKGWMDDGLVEGGRGWWDLDSKRPEIHGALISQGLRASIEKATGGHWQVFPRHNNPVRCESPVHNTVAWRGHHCPSYSLPLPCDIQSLSSFLSILCWRWQPRLLTLSSAFSNFCLRQTPAFLGGLRMPCWWVCNKAKHFPGQMPDQNTDSLLLFIGLLLFPPSSLHRLQIHLLFLRVPYK